MKKFKRFLRQPLPDPIAEWLEESSTWRGIILLVSSTGFVSLKHDEAADLVIAAGLFLVGLVNTIRRESSKGKRPNRRRTRRDLPKYPRR